MIRYEYLGLCPYCGKIVTIMEYDPVFRLACDNTLIEWRRRGLKVIRVPRDPAGLSQAEFCTCFQPTKEGQLPLPGFNP